MRRRIILVFVSAYISCCLSQENATVAEDGTLNASDRRDLMCRKDGSVTRCECPEEYGYVETFFGYGECKACNCGRGNNCTFVSSFKGLQVNGKTCKCKKGYTEIRGTCIGPCSRNPCKNGGTCEDTTNGYMCQCQYGFIGFTCDEKISYCKNKPCKNNAFCREIFDINGISYDHKCICLDGFSGINCEINENGTRIVKHGDDDSRTSSRGISIGVPTIVVVVIIIAIFLCLRKWCRRSTVKAAGIVVSSTRAPARVEPPQLTVVLNAPPPVYHTPLQQAPPPVYHTPLQQAPVYPVGPAPPPIPVYHTMEQAPFNPNYNDPQYRY